jgi:hypothetical protein
MKTSFPSGHLLYRYEPLQSSRYIRLLKLRGQAAKWRQRSHELINVHLDHAPTFCAISYRWDAEKGFGYISIGSKVLRVTLSCKASINYFSKMMPGQFIWIDAVCINQSDIKERNTQVTLMRNIYQSAYSTAVWLGEALPDHEFALNLYAALRSGIFDINNMETEKREDPFHPFHPRRETDEGVKQPYHNDCRKVPVTLELVLQRSWFGRVWMIQEVALAQRIVVCCANALIEWSQLVEATRRLATAQGPNRKALFDLPLKIMEARDHYQQHTFGFHQILPLSRSFDASDPRDKIYGMLGLSEDFANAIGPPDYNKPVADVWLNMASIYLKRYSLGGLSMLTSAIDLLNMQEALSEYMDEEHREEAIPTWLEGLDRVPARRNSEGQTYFQQRPSWVPNLDFPLLEWPMNDAIDSSNDHLHLGKTELQIDYNKLHILGAIVSTITIVAYGNTSGNNRQMWWAWDKWMELAGWLDMTQRQVRHPEHPDTWFKYFTGESMLLVFWKTILCDVNNEIEDDDSLGWWHNWFCCELWMNLLMMDSRFLITRDTDQQQLGKRTTSTALVRNATRHKKFFQAEDIIGIGPLGIQEKDKIVMLHGYKYPFVARPKSPSTQWLIPWRKAKAEYHLVGPCFVHAIWDWDKYHDKKLEWGDLTFI